MEQRREQKLSQLQQSLVTILAMNVQELDAHLNHAFLENPFIEICEASEPGRGYAPAEDPDEVLNRIRAPGMHHRYEPFIEQLELKAFTYSELKLMCAMIDNLNENGYYPLSEEETAQMLGADVCAVEKCLSALRTLDPPGVFAENMAECLIEQLHRRGYENPELEALLRNSPEIFVSGTGGKQISDSRLRKYKNILLELSPRPFFKPDCRKNGYAVPDLLCYREEDSGQWKVSVLERSHYVLSSLYAELADAGDRESRDYMNQKRAEAELLLNAVKMRENTMQDLAALLLERQAGALICGQAPAPLTMKEAAALLNVSESTVSRACSGKYIEAPAGTFALKNLFPGAEKSCGMSATQIMNCIKNMVAEEKADSPLSDDEIRLRLSDIGIRISRRTVSKYRGLLGIPDSFARRRDCSD